MDYFIIVLMLIIRFFKNREILINCKLILQNYSHFSPWTNQRVATIKSKKEDEIWINLMYFVGFIWQHSNNRISSVFSRSCLKKGHFFKTVLFFNIVNWIFVTSDLVANIKIFSENEFLLILELNLILVWM